MEAGLLSDDLSGCFVQIEEWIICAVHWNLELSVSASFVINALFEVSVLRRKRSEE